LLNPKGIHLKGIPWRGPVLIRRVLHLDSRVVTPLLSKQGYRSVPRALQGGQVNLEILLSHSILIPPLLSLLPLLLPEVGVEHLLPLLLYAAFLLLDHPAESLGLFHKALVALDLVVGPLTPLRLVLGDLVPKRVVVIVLHDLAPHSLLFLHLF